MATYNATLTVRLNGIYSGTSDLTTRTDGIDYLKEHAYSSGSGSNACNLFHADTLTLAAAAQTIDLTSDLRDAFGTTFLPAKIRTIILFNSSTTAGQIVTVSGNFLSHNATSPLGGTTPTLKLAPGEVRVMESPIDGFLVTNTTGDQLTLDPGTNTISVDIVMAGTIS